MLDECDLMKRSNSCSRGLFRATQGGWSKTITMTSGGLDISDWCFCHVKPYDKSNSYFKVIYHKFEVIFLNYQFVTYLLNKHVHIFFLFQRLMLMMTV